MNRLMKIALSVVILLNVSQSAMAAAYDADGRVMIGTTQELTAEDLVYFGTAAATATVLGFIDVSKTVTLGMFAASVIGWGAWRTAQHRPDSVKQLIAQNKALQAAQPVPGSVAHVLR